MVTDEQVKIYKGMLNELGNRLYSDILFCNKFIEHVDNPEIEKKWMMSVATGFDYSIVLIRCFMKSMDDYKSLRLEKFSFYLGKIAIQNLIEIINSYEQTINSFFETDSKIKTLIQDRIDKKIEIINKSFGDNCTGYAKKMKKDIIKELSNKIHEMAFIRDTLKSNMIIDETDVRILKFAWDIRNSMHTNYTSINDINFEFPDLKTGHKYKFVYHKGEELYHPENFIGFYIITEQIQYILLKILQKARN